MVTDNFLKSPHLLLKTTLSPVVLHLMEEAVKPEPDFEVLAKTISLDPILTATVLNLVNSPFYSLSQQVKDIQRAAVVLGTREILKVAFSIAYQKDLQKQLVENDYDAFPDWRFIIWSAIAAQLLAERLCPEHADQAYLCALLKDISLLFLKSAAPDQLGFLSEKQYLTALEPGQLEREQELWGMEHGALSQLLLAKWNIPSGICESIRNHHHIDDLERHDPLTQCVILATRWAEMEIGYLDQPFNVFQFGLILRRVLDVTDDELDELRAECTDKYRSMLSSAGLDEGDRDRHFYTHSMVLMQRYYFLSMDLFTAEGGVSSIPGIVARHLKMHWDLDRWDLALRPPGGRGYLLFQFDAREGLSGGHAETAAADLDWRFKERGLPLRAKGVRWGELRFSRHDLGADALSELTLYLRFISQGYEHYCARQAVVEAKAGLFDSLPMGVGRLEPEGVVAEANPRFCEFLGLRSIPKGKPVDEIFQERLGLALGAEWKDFLAHPDRPSYSRILCCRDRRPDREGEVCMYLAALREGLSGDERILFLVEDVNDVTEIEVQALKQRDFLARLVGAMRDLVFSVDTAGRIRFASGEGAQYKGRQFFEVFLPTRSFTETWDSGLLETLHQPVEAVLGSDGSGGRPFELIFSRLEKAGGRLHGGQDYLVVARDLTSVRRLEQKLKMQAIYDGLTGLFNHYQFRSLLEQEVRRSKRTGRKMGVLFFDLDGFKQINDTQGHQAGDAMLKLVGQILTHELRQGMDFPCRYGGDEFAVIVTEIEAGYLQTIGERLRKAIADQFSGKLTISAGLTIIGENDTPDNILNRADMAAYQAKAAGGNTIVWAK